MSLHRFLFRPLFLLNQSENKMFSLLMKLTLKVDDADPRYSHGNGRYKSCRWLHSNSVCRKKSVSHEDSMSWKNKMLSKEEKWKKRVSTCSTRIGNFYISDDKHQNIVNKELLWTHTNQLLFWSQITWSIKMVVEIFGLNCEKYFE